MSASRMIRFVVSPALYALVVIPVFFSVVACIAWFERHVGLHTIWRTGDVELSVFGVLLGGAAFTMTTLALARLEWLERPRCQDHLRHSALLYLVVALSGTWLVSTRAQLGGGLAWGLSATATMLAAFAALVNGATLKVLASRGSRSNQVPS